MNTAQAISLYGSENPYSDAEARANSCYSGIVDGVLVRLLDWHKPDARLRMAHNAFQKVISEDSYPCLGAKSVVARGSYRLGLYTYMGTAAATRGLARDLCAFRAERPLIRGEFASYVAVFEGPQFQSELEFESALWSQLQRLYDLDRDLHGWDRRVRADPGDPQFAYSFAGEAYFVVGLHLLSSRRARRFPWPALVFNAHTQFDELRERTIYDQFVRAIRTRDAAFQGTVNPMMNDFGTVSEARQYAGRAVPADWKCPFKP